MEHNRFISLFVMIINTSVRLDCLCILVNGTSYNIEDASTNIYIKTKVKAATDTSELMECFIKKEVDNPKFPNLSYRVNYLKNNQKGVRAMCDVVERYAADAIKEIKEEYKAALAAKDSQIADKDFQLAHKDSQIADKDSQIADLIRQLQEAQQKNMD